MSGFITAIIIVFAVFVIFGRDEQGLTRFQRRKMRREERETRRRRDDILWS